MDDSVFACDETIEKAVSTNSDEKKQSVKQKFLYLLAFLIITITLLMAFRISFCQRFF